MDTLVKRHQICMNTMTKDWGKCKIIVGGSDLVSTFKCFETPRWTLILKEKDFGNEDDISKSLEQKRSDDERKISAHTAEK